VLLEQHGYRRVSVEDVAARAGVGKGTVYLHWATREALFWAVVQREAMRLLDDLAARLDGDAGLALPHRLMPALFTEVQHRPLVRALLLSDAEVLGALAADDSVAAAQRELAGNPDYLDLLAGHGLLRPGLAPSSAGHILGSVMRGFFAAQDADSSSGPGAGLPADQRADLLTLGGQSLHHATAHPAARARHENRHRLIPPRLLPSMGNGMPSRNVSCSTSEIPTSPFIPTAPWFSEY